MCTHDNLRSVRVHGDAIPEIVTRLAIRCKDLCTRIPRQINIIIGIDISRTGTVITTPIIKGGPHDNLHSVPTHGDAIPEIVCRLPIRWHDLCTRIPRRTIIGIDISRTSVIKIVQTIYIMIFIACPHDNLRSVRVHGDGSAEIVKLLSVRCHDLCNRTPPI